MTKLSVRLLAASAAIIFIISVLAAAQNRGDSAVYRLYNPNSGEHLLTRDCTEKRAFRRAADSITKALHFTLPIGRAAGFGRCTGSILRRECISTRSISRK